jgi:ABC-type uncharacterized transport system substrate-binding protein
MPKASRAVDIGRSGQALRTVVGGWLAWLGLALAVSSAPGARAQEARALPLVAIFNGGYASAFGPHHEAFLRAMAEAGWREGETVRYEVRWAGNRLETFASIAEELVQMRPAMILAVSSPGAVAVARAAHGRIPVVTIDDPVALGPANASLLPIEFLREFDLVINLNAANTLGIKVPEELLLRAATVIR